MRTKVRRRNTLVLRAGLILGLWLTYGWAGTTIDEEARKQAEQYFAQRLTKCGATHVLRDGYVSNLPSNIGLPQGPFLVQYKGLMTRMIAQPLDALDRQNGYEWRGMSLASAQAVRQYEERTQTWTEWEWITKDFAGVSLVKRHGQWTLFGTNVFGRAETKRLDCSKFPQ